MAHIRVKDMPRKQQKAVFAAMGDGLCSTVSEKDLNAKRDRLAKEGLVTETVQDKKDRILQDKRLTHRQKMALIARLGMVPEKPARQHWSATIVRVPSGFDRGSFDSIIMKKKLPSTNLYDSGGLLLTQKEYVRGTKNSVRLPKGSKVIEVPPGHNRSAFDAYMYRAKAKPGTYVKDGKLVLSMADYKKGLHRNARVRYGIRDWKEKHRIEQDLAIKESKKGYTEKGIRPPGVAAIYEKALVKHDEKRQEKLERFRKIASDHNWSGAGIAIAEKSTGLSAETYKRLSKKSNITEPKNYRVGISAPTTSRVKLYKDAFATSKEADEVAMSLTKSGKKDVFVFKDNEGDYNISYND